MNTNMDPVERMISAVSYLWILFFLPLVLMPNSGFGRFHANQALLNLIWGVVFGILVRLIPLLLFKWLFGLVMMVYPIWGIITAMRRSNTNIRTKPMNTSIMSINIIMNMSTGIIIRTCIAIWRT